MQIEYDYSDIFLYPSMTKVSSRSICDTSVRIGNRKFDLPVIPANMKSLIDEDSCVYFARKNLFYIMHRFDIDVVQFCTNMQRAGLYTSISAGITQDNIDELKKLTNNKINPDYITIDIANAYTNEILPVIRYIKDHFSSTLIVGNVATEEGVQFVEDAGANISKCGIAGGISCRTRNKTGFYRPMFSCIQSCSAVAKKPIIADGGVREHADIAKAVAAGASYVMAGSLFAGYDQSAGDIVEVDGRRYKEYYGNASEFAKGHRKHIEGAKIHIEYKGDMDHLLKELKEDLQSSISYASGNKLYDLYNAKYGIIHK
jgi:GMP reductase